MSRDFASPNYLSLGDVAAIDLTGTGPLTLAAWVKMDTVNVNHPIFQKGGSSATTTQYSLNTNSTGLPTCFVGDAAGQDSAQGAVAVTAGVWTHLAGRRLGSTLEVFLNGVSAASIASTRSMQNLADELRIGARSSGTITYQDGLIADAAIWNIGLLNDQIKALAMAVSPLVVHPGPNLRGYWPILGIGSPEADLSEWRTNAVISGSLAFAEHCPAGPYVLN